MPWTNFAGWFLVTAVTIGINQVLDAALSRWYAGQYSNHRPRIPYVHLGGFALFVFIVGFNLFMTAWLREWSLFFAGLPLALAVLLCSRRILAGGHFLAPHLTGRATI